LKTIVPLHDIAVGSEAIGQIQNSAGMTTIHQTSHGNAAAEGLDQNFENVIVTNLPIALKVYRNKRFIKTIIFVAVLISDTTPVTCS
jgi:hypothetical protein